MHRPVTTTFSTAHGFAANDCSAVQSRPAEIAADPRDELEHYLPALRAFALVLVGTRALADDIVARTIVAAWANIDAYDRGTSLRVWLFRMLHTLYFAQLHPSERSTASDIGVRLDVTALQVRPVAGPADPRFWRSFSALAVEQREALILIGPARFSHDEAASVCGCTQATIRSRSKLGRRKLAMLVLQESQAANPANSVVAQAPLGIRGPRLPAGSQGAPAPDRHNEAGPLVAGAGRPGASVAAHPDD